MARRYPTRDTHRLEILKALEERTIDRDLFEQVMADVLRASYPTLAPVSGGSDYGQDGVGLGADGEAFSLIVTTAIDVRGNLENSLERAALHGKPRKVVLVTSQSLTPKKRKNYEELAVEKGFQLLQIIDQDGVANHLFHRSDRVRELLGISGRPKALSTVPRTRRLPFDVPLLGRDEDLTWLREHAGELGEDCIVAGEPGSGKTYLLSQLVDQEDGWFFLVDDDPEAVANALRDLERRVVIVDDAHTKSEAVGLLRHQRDRGVHQFAIVATTWESAAGRVRQDLGIVSDDQVRRLELLTRRELQTLFESLHLEANDAQLKELIDQSAKKPGLAVTLGLAWRRGGRKVREELWKGQALFDLLAPLIKDLLDGERLVPLAVLALAGESGLRLEDVASALGEPVAKLFDEASRLSAAGILAERDEGRLAIQPRAFRAPLMGRVFFDADGPRLDIGPFLEVITDREAMVRGLLEARVREVPVPDELLFAQLKDLPSARLWRDFATLGPRPAQWAIDEFPQTLDRAAEAEALDPRMALLAGLFETGDEASRKEARQRRIIQANAGALHSAPESAVGSLLAQGPEMTQQILEELRPWSGELQLQLHSPLDRRRILAEQAVVFLEQGGDQELGVSVLNLAFDSGLKSTSVDPVVGRQVTFHRDLITSDELRELRVVWRSLVERLHRGIGTLDGGSWRPFQRSLRDLIRPPLGEPTEDWSRLARSLASEIVADLEPLAQGQLGIQHELSALGGELGIEIEHSTDEVFELLIASSRKDFRAGVERLVEKWSKQPPDKVARRIEQLVETASQTVLGSSLSTRLHEIAREISQRATDVVAWFEALEPLSPLGLARWFLSRAVKDQVSGWEELLDGALGKSALSTHAAGIVLNLPRAAGHRFFDRATQVALESPFPVIEDAAFRGIEPEVTKRLLQHEDAAISGRAAMSEWFEPEPGSVREEVEEEWREAVLGLTPSVWARLAEQHVFADEMTVGLLGAYPQLAFDWLCLYKDVLNEARSEEVIRAAIKSLDRDQRSRLIQTLGEGVSGGLVRDLVGREPSVYRDLLESRWSATQQLEPLNGPPDDRWRELAVMALDHGHSSDMVSRALFWAGHTCIGSGLDYWQNWQTTLERHARDPDHRIRTVIETALERVRLEIQEAQNRERNIELHGLG